MKIKVKCDYCGEKIYKKQGIIKRNKHNFCNKECYYKWKIGEKNHNYIRRKKDYIMTEEHRKNISNGKKGVKFTKEHRNNISRSNIGKPGYWLGKKRSREDIAKFRKSHLGKKQSDEIRLKRMKSISGSNNYNWKGGLTSVVRQVRRCFKYRQWRSDIFTRDGFICVLCGKKSNWIEADHYPKSFSDIFYRNKIKTIEESLECEEFWDINNGRTLCFKCHDKTKKNQRNRKIC